MLRVHNAATAIDALAVIEREIAYGTPEAYDALLELDGLCAIEMFPNSPSEMEWALSQVATYCSGYRGIDRVNGGAEHQELAALGVAARTERELSQALRQHGAMAASDEVLRILASSSNAYELREALNFAAARGLPILPQNLHAQSNPNFNKNVLQLAASLAYCRASGVCGPRSSSMVGACISFGVCDPHLGLPDALRMISSPIEFAAAQSFVDQAMSRANWR
ncbi:MAG: hypothetical protein ACK4RW_06250 [Rehaibacterium terrae]|uniref:hypothetical protein n=1 Tax=Rehaibacterium terrae TaxID=1341696 RepID=UPI00391A5160